MSPAKLILSTIVEGDGEVVAFPILLRRIAAWLSPGLVVEVPRPFQVKRDRFVNKADQRERAIRFASLRGTPENSAILVLIDADQDCPAQLGPRLLHAIQSSRPDYRHAMILAKCEYEAWFLAAAASLRGKRNFVDDLEIPPDPEAIQGAKEWIKRHRTDKKYSAVLDQPALSHLMSLSEARQRSPSFDKLCRDLEALFRGTNG